MSSKRRTPSLDGLRGVFLSIVLCLHLRGGSPAWIKFDIGMFGMFVFFVMSGFIITRLLIEEREQTGAVSLRSFYGRRFFRIFPALFGYLCGVALLSAVGLTRSSIRELFLGLTFIANYRYSGFQSLGHLWSLSVEEQFYLLWPLLFSRFSTRNVSRLLLAVIFSVPLMRLLHLAHGADWVQLEWHSESVADSLAVGCLLAIAQPQLHSNRAYQWFRNSKLCLVIPVLIILAGWQRSAFFYQGFGKTIVLLLIAAGMDISIRRSDSVWGKFLNSHPLVKLGTWSYSLYLWQQVFTVPQVGTQPYAWFPMNLALTLIAGIASYYAIERPSLRWGRDLLARQRTPAVVQALEKTA